MYSEFLKGNLFRAIFNSMFFCQEETEAPERKQCVKICVVLAFEESEGKVFCVCVFGFIFPVRQTSLPVDTQQIGIFSFVRVFAFFNNFVELWVQGHLFLLYFTC